MKKIIVVFILVLSLVVGLPVSAKKLTCEEVTNDIELRAKEYFYKYQYQNNMTGVWFNYKNPTVQYGIMYKFYPMYVLKDNFGASYVMYCRNPDYSSGYADNIRYSCKESVLNVSENTELKNKYDAGVVAILKNGYSAPTNATTYTLSSSKTDASKFVSTELALRIYEMLWEEIDTNNKVSNMDRSLAAHRWYVNEFLKNEDIKKLMQELNISKKPFASKDILEPIDFEFYKNGNWNADITTSVVNNAKTLVITGLKGALEYQKNGAANLIISDPVEQPIITKTDSDGNKEYQKNILYTFKAENFKSNAYIKMSLDCKNCKEFDADYTIYINDQHVGEKFPDNLLSYLDSNGSGEIKVRIEFKTSASNYNCGKIKYVLEVDYYDETINTEAYTLYSDRCSSSANCQNFYLLYDYGTDVYEEKDLEGSFRLCELSCTQLQTQCEKDKNSDACEEFNKKYNGTCADCGMQVQNATCSKTDSEIKLNEGHEFEEESCTSSEKPNVLGCVINNSDDAGNSYEAINILNNNNYCSVWCKEDYKFNMPGIKTVNSGRYFLLTANISGTKTCYTSKIDTDAFENDYKSANTEVLNAYNEYKNATGNDKTEKGNTLNSKIENLNNIFESYNACSNWNMNYNFDPDVKFWYEESYMNKVFTDKFETTGEVSKTDADVSICTSDTNDSYEYCKNNWKEENSYKDITLNTCYKDSNNNYVCGNKKFSVSTTLRMKVEMNAEGKYITPTQFYTIYPTGAIAVSKTGAPANSSPLKNGLPIGLGTKQGVYNYALSVENLGEYYNSDDLGRIWGDDNSALTVTLKEQEENKKCTAGSLISGTTINGTHLNNGVYVCSYKVNCNDCPVVCEPDGCYNPNCPDNSCPVVCENCIYNNNNSNINYRPITPDDLNPGDRDLGKNWAHDDSISTALEMKAYVTTEEIEENGNSIYDINFESTDIDDDFAMEVTLDSNMISKIRKYNNKYEGKGGYYNNTLECYDHTNSEDGQTYNNIYCYSTFLDDLLKDEKTKNNIKITGGTRYLNDSDRERSTQWSGYWTTWSEANLNKWTVTTEHGIAYYKQNYAEIGIGPAWK